MRWFVAYEYFFLIFLPIKLRTIFHNIYTFFNESSLFFTENKLYYRERVTILPRTRYEAPRTRYATFFTKCPENGVRTPSIPGGNIDFARPYKTL